MRKPIINYIVDLILFGLMGGMVFIGILLGWTIPAGPGQEKYFWSLHRHQWGEIHLWISLLFLGFLVVHLVLHWKWIRGSTRRITGRSWVLPFFFLVPAMVVLLAQAGYKGDNVDRRGRGQRSGRQCQQLQPENKGSMKKQKRTRHRGGKRGKQRHRWARGTSR